MERVALPLIIVPRYDIALSSGNMGTEGDGMAPKKIEFESWSLDELWALHGEISGILSARIRAEKGELEKRWRCLVGARSSQTIWGIRDRYGTASPVASTPGVTEVSESPDLGNLVGAWQAAELVGGCRQVGTQDRRVPD